MDSGLRGIITSVVIIVVSGLEVGVEAVSDTASVEIESVTSGMLVVSSVVSGSVSGGGG